MLKKHVVQYERQRQTILADRTATQYDRLLASSLVRQSVCLSVCL